MKRKAKEVLIAAAAVTAVSILGCGSGDTKAGSSAGTPAQSASMETAETHGLPGESAYDFTLKDLSGKDVKLSDFKGKVVILDFWATWCGPCRMELPHFKELHKEFESKGVQIVGVALDQQGASVVAPFVQKSGIEYVTLIGTQDVVGRYGNIRGIPTTFIIDQTGKIVTSFVGYRTKDVFVTEIAKLLGTEG